MKGLKGRTLKYRPDMTADLFNPFFRVGNIVDLRIQVNSNLFVRFNNPNLG